MIQIFTAINQRSYADFTASETLEILIFGKTDQKHGGIIQNHHVCFFSNVTIHLRPL